MSQVQSQVSVKWDWNQHKLTVKSCAKAVKKTQHSTTTLESNAAFAGPSRSALKPKSPPLELTKEQAEKLALFQYNAEMARTSSRQLWTVYSRL